jgi:hemolysin activation/secretion protein
MKCLIKKVVLWSVLGSLLPGVLFAIPLNTTILPSRQSPVNPPLNGGLPKPEAPLETPGNKNQGVDQSALKVKFHLKKIVLEGNKTYTYAQLEPIFKQSLGKEISLADLQAIAAAIEKYYIEQGFILTRVIIPPQEIDASGVVKLQIVEGYIAEVMVEGDTKRIKKQIDAYVAPVLQSKPLQIKVLERAVLLINDLPGVATKAVLTPSPDVPGATTLVLVVDRSLFQGSGTWDDRGTKYVGMNQLSTTLQLNNIFEGIGQLEFDGKITSDTNELRSGNLQYMAEVFENGSTILASYTENIVQPGNTLAPLHIFGFSNTWALIYNYPFIRTRRLNLSGNVTYDYLNSSNDIFKILVTLDRIESLRAGFSFNAVDDMGGMNLLVGQFSQGIQLFSGNPQPEILRSRFDGQKNYGKVNLTYTRLQSLPETWSLFLSANGQLAFNSLLAAEQIGYGGVLYGSAYDSSEIIGDTGFEGKIELRYNAQPGQFFRTTQYYVSYDGAALYDKHVVGLGNGLPPGAGGFIDQSKQSGTSGALGVRLDIVDRVNSSFEIAKPLTRKVAAYDNKAPRFFFSITVDLGH